MALRESKFQLTELQWLKIRLRLAAREQSGSRLSYRFEFSAEPSTDVTCYIYYTDDESNPMKQIGESERTEIYQGRVEVGMYIIRRLSDWRSCPTGLSGLRHSSSCCLRIVEWVGLSCTRLARLSPGLKDKDKSPGIRVSRVLTNQDGEAQSHAPIFMGTRQSER